MPDNLTPKKDQEIELADPSPERAWFPLFLASLRNSGNVRAACKAAGISRETAYDNRRSNAVFAQAWAEAIEDACDLLEAAAWVRARSTSDTLLIFLLKAHRPEKYRETTRHLHVGITAEQAAQMTDEQLDEELKRLGLA